MGFKYVMFNNGVSDVPIIFPDAMCHISIATAITQQGEFKHYRLVSAGFIQLGVNVETYGKSETLNIESRPEDTIIIKHYPYMFGLRNPEMEKIIDDANNKLKGERT